MTHQECRKFSENTMQLFHHLVAKLLYFCRPTKPGHPDSDGLMCTRVKNPDPDDYKKLINGKISNTKGHII